MMPYVVLIMKMVKKYVRIYVLYFRSRIRVTPRFFEYKVLKLIINVKLNNIVSYVFTSSPQSPNIIMFTIV